MPTETLMDIITDSLTLINAVADGETITNDEAQWGLRHFNRLMASWSSDNLMIQAATVENLTLVVGNGAPTIGTGGTFNTARPISIIGCAIRSDGLDFPMESMDEGKYKRITSKTTPGRPTRYWYNPTYPLGTIYFDYEPVTADTLVLHSTKPLTEITDLTTDITLSGEYLSAIETNLALILCVKYDKEPSSVLVAAAESSKRRLQNLRAAEQLMTVDLDELCFGRNRRGSTIFEG